MCDCCFLLSALFAILAGFSSALTGTGYFAAQGELLPLPECVQNFAHSAGLFWILSDCAINPIKASPAFSRSFESDWLSEG